MTAFIIPDDDSGRIITFDAILSELHETVSEVSDHPVESGVNISDHVRPLPDRLSLTAYTTNTPIRVDPFKQRGEVVKGVSIDIPRWEPPLEATPGSLFRSAIGAVDGLLFGGPPERTVTVLQFENPFDAIYETYEILRELQTNAVLLQIVTPIRTYEDMVLERVAAPRTGGDAGVAFGLDVRQLRVVESGQVAAPPVPADNVPGGKPLENKGGQGAKPPAAGEDSAASGSLAFKFLSGIGAL